MKKLNIMKKLSILTLSVLVVLPALSLKSAMVIPALNSPVTVDFDNDLPGVNAGAFAGTGLVAEPSAGQLNSNAWRITGVRPGDTTFGGDHTDVSFTRGLSTGGVLAGGLYAFDVGGGNRTLGIQPHGQGDFIPGAITLRIQNNTGGTVNSWDLSYDLFVLNDQNRSHSFDWAWSTDDVTYTNLHEYVSPQGADALGWSNVASPAASNLSASVVDGGYLYLQWAGAYVAGSGGYDEFAIDNISVTAIPEPATAALLVGGLGLLLVVRRRRQ